MFVVVCRVISWRITHSIIVWLYPSTLFHKFFIESRLNSLESGYSFMFKVLVSFILCLFLIFFYFDEKNSNLPVFQLTDTPSIITKGQFGASLIVELSYSHEGIEDWLTDLHEPYPLFLVQSDWLLRSPELVRLLIEKNIRVGLLGSPSDQYKDNELLKKQLAIFEKTFYKKPLWFSTADYMMDESMQTTLHELEINLIAPTHSFPIEESQIDEGVFVSIPLHRDEFVSFDEINQFMKKHSFVSVEQNIFGYEISTKRFPYPIMPQRNCVQIFLGPTRRGSINRCRTMRRF